MTQWHFLLNSNENTCSKKNYETVFEKELQNDVHSVIGTSKLETSYISINRCSDKHKGTPHTNAKEETADVHHSLSQSQK